MRINAVCDIGSLDGTEALLFRATLPDADIYAFEPHPENFHRMQTDPRLRKNHIRLAQLAATDYDGTAEFSLVGTGYSPGERWRGMSSLHKRSHRPELLTSIEVQTARLDTFLADRVSPDLRLGLWIDTEGKGYEVIAGAKGLMRNIHLLHIEVETSRCIGETQKLYPQVKALLDSAGFFELATDGSPGQAQFNALFLRKDLPLGLRCRAGYWSMRAHWRRAAGKIARKFCYRAPR